MYAYCFISYYWLFIVLQTIYHELLLWCCSSYCLPWKVFMIRFLLKSTPTKYVNYVVVIKRIGRKSNLFTNDFQQRALRVYTVRSRTRNTAIQTFYPSSMIGVKPTPVRDPAVFLTCRRSSPARSSYPRSGRRPPLSEAGRAACSGPAPWTRLAAGSRPESVVPCPRFRSPCYCYLCVISYHASSATRRRRDGRKGLLGTTDPGEIDDFYLATSADGNEHWHKRRRRCDLRR